MYEIITTHKGKSVDEIKVLYNNNYDEIIQEYFDFLCQNEYVFYTDTPDRFPELDLSWEEPTPLTNAIIDISEKSPLLDYEDIITQMGALGCEHIQIRSFSERALSFFENVLNTIGTKRIISVELIIKFHITITEEKLLNLYEQFPRLFSIIVHSAPSSKIVNILSQGMGHIKFIIEEISSSSHCGIISSDYFNINIKSFTEAYHYNSCLNKKISIDVNGNIKNCPSMQKSYGSVKDSTLLDALNHPEFKNVWFINKDQIETCKSCEFRYICTDCRAYIEKPNDIYSKPLKCGYNPNTTKWEEWSLNPLKQKAMDYYRF